MERRILNFFRGYVRILIYGSSYDRFLNLCAYHDIYLWDLQPTEEDSYEAYISVKDFRRLKMIVRKSHVKLRISRRRGIPFFIYRYKDRKMCLAGILAAFFLMIWLSGRIWNITIDGNLSQTNDVMLEYLQNEGITQGMKKSGINCKELSAQIRNYFTQFSWVTAELEGTRLLIHVKEGILSDEQEDTSEAEKLSGTASSLAAAKAGTILSIYVRSGRPLVAAGDAVEKGDVLVSGALPVYNDSKEVSSWQYTQADADIVIRTETSYYDKLELKAQKKYYTGEEKSGWGLRILGNLFTLPFSLRSFENYDAAVYIRQLKIDENFYLPVYIQKTKIKEYEKREVTYGKNEAKAILDGNFQYFTKNLKQKGVQIFENNVKIKWNADTAVASGTLVTGEPAYSRITTDSVEEDSSDHEYG